MAGSEVQGTVTDTQTGQTPRKRAPPPSLAPLQSLNPYLAGPASIRSTPGLSSSTLSFLSPPILNIPLSSPPPQVEGGDYLTTYPHSTQPKKRRHRHSKRLPTFLQSTKDKQQGPSTVVDDRDLKADGSDSEDRKSTASDISSLSKVPVALDTAELMVRRQSTQSSLMPTTTFPSVKGDLTATSQAVSEAERDSAAMSSLRRMNHATKRFSVSKAQDSRRFSHALAATIHQPTIKEPLYHPSDSADVQHIFKSGITQTDVDDFLNGADAQKPLQQNIVKRNPVDQERVALETPTTITLRKASDAYFFVIGPKDAKTPARSDKLPAGSNTPTQSQEPSVALVDFRSKRLCDARKSLWYSLPLLSEQDDVKIPEPPTNGPAATKPEDSRPEASLPMIQPRAQPSDPALTFSSVHRTTPTCFLDPPTRHSSVSPASKPRRRTSTVHVHTRTSVHEIVWAEDENTNTSSSSSRESTSPTRPLTRAPSLVAGNITPKQCSRSEPASPNIPNRTASPEETIFDWSWNAPAGASLQPRILEDDQPAVCSPIDVLPPETRRQKRSSVSKDSSVESFPPLLPRDNTTEWRRTPLVDINEPLAGRATARCIPVAGQTRGEGQGKEVKEIERTDQEQDGDGEEGGLETEGNEEGGNGDPVDERLTRRASCHPYAEARMGEKGRVGSSVGINRRKRVSWTRS